MDALFKKDLRQFTEHGKEVSRACKVPTKQALLVGGLRDVHVREVLRPEGVLRETEGNMLTIPQRRLVAVVPNPFLFRLLSPCAVFLFLAPCRSSLFVRLSAADVISGSTIIFSSG